MLALDQLMKVVVIHWLIRFFATRHSVLGGEVPASDWGQVQHRAMIVGLPIGTLKNFLETCLFVVALVATKNLVHMVLDSQRPDIAAAVRGAVPRYREVLLFSIKYMAVMAVIGVVIIFVTTSPLMPEGLRHAAISKPFITVFALAAECCLAWLLLPAAIRLLRLPDGPAISTEQRKVGTVAVVATAAASMVLEYSIRKAEAATTLGSVFGGWAIAVVNTVIFNAPQVMLFIVLALLAIQVTADESAPAAEPGLS
jgi:hypothetical protein